MALQCHTEGRGESEKESRVWDEAKVLTWRAEWKGGGS